MHSARLVAIMAALACCVVWCAAPAAAAEGKAGRTAGPAGTIDASWMAKAKYGVFLHYQYRVLLGTCVRTKPQFPEPSQMTAQGWNQFVDGFDVEGFARQMAEGRVGWVLFCIDDHYFAWPCAPNKAFSAYTGYAPGEKCSRRDLIMDLADALNANGVKLICYFAGLNGYMKDRNTFQRLADDGNNATPPSAESRKRRLEVLREYCDRYGEKVAGWWFDGMEIDSYSEQPNDWWTIHSIVRKPNPNAVIAFSYGRNEWACIRRGLDDFTGGDTWSKQDLTRLTPKRLPAQDGILWHGKIYCGNVYHGLGEANQFSDRELIDWINACTSQGGVCTLDWPFDPKTGLIKDFGMAQLKAVAAAIHGPRRCSQRQAEPAASESWRGAPLKWTAYPGNPVLSAGPPGAWDENIRERMWVLYDGGRFHGWYGGWKGKYDKKTPNLVHLGYATSDDGVRWTKHPQNPVFAGRWVEDVCVVRSDDTYYLYGEDETENKTVIHLLTSTDGVKWAPRGNVLEKTAGSDWEGGWVGTPLVWREPKRWYMLYEGGPHGTIGLATSADGTGWQKSKDNPVLRHAAKGAWDDSVVGPSSILKQDDRYYLFYIGGGAQFRDGVAVSTDLVRWSRYPANPVVSDMSAVVVATPDRYLLYCRQNPSGSAANLYVAPK